MAGLKVLDLLHEPTAAALRTSEYLKDKSAYEIAEEIMFGSEIICSFPIVWEGNKYLLARLNEGEKAAVLEWCRTRYKSEDDPMMIAIHEHRYEIISAFLPLDVELQLIHEEHVPVLEDYTCKFNEAEFHKNELVAKLENRWGNKFSQQIDFFHSFFKETGVAKQICGGIDK